MQLRLFCIDDEPEILEALREILSSETVAVEIFEDPLKAIDRVHASPPDLIIVDFRMPSMTGDEFAQKIDSQIPKILISGESDMALKSNYLKTFSKPFDVKDLIEFIDAFQEEKLKIAS